MAELITRSDIFLAGSHTILPDPNSMRKDQGCFLSSAVAFLITFSAKGKVIPVRKDLKQVGFKMYIQKLKQLLELLLLLLFKVIPYYWSDNPS